VRNIKYIIFDFDGTIADTLGMTIYIFNRIAPEYDCKPINDEDWELIRTKRPQDLLKVCGVTNLKLVLILLRVRKEMSRLIPEIRPVKNITDAYSGYVREALRLRQETRNPLSLKLQRTCQQPVTSNQQQATSNFTHKNDHPYKNLLH